MDFARKQLEKYGWKEGEGVGKDGNKGISVAIKPKCKNGKEGMGFDMAKDLVDPWWSRAYDDSLKRINVKDTTEENKKVVVSFDLESEELYNAIRPLDAIRKRGLKSNFVEFSKGATLVANGEMKKEINSSDSGEDSSNSEISNESKSTKKRKQLTDDELFKACGGRTAHKSARFGLKLNGKLARIAAQEEQLFSKDSQKLEIKQGCKRKLDS